jgi:hypothetical protein
MGSLTFKDFLPLIGTLITVIGGYRLISVQINKNRKAKWLDDFRREFASFFALASSINRDFTPDKAFEVYVDKCYELLASTTTLTLFLIDTKEDRSLLLIDRLREFHTMILHQKDPHDLEYVKEFGEKLAHIMTLVTGVIITEQKKI